MGLQTVSAHLRNWPEELVQSEWLSVRWKSKCSHGHCRHIRAGVLHPGAAHRAALALGAERISGAVTRLHASACPSLFAMQEEQMSTRPSQAYRAPVFSIQEQRIEQLLQEAERISGIASGTVTARLC